MLVCFESFNVSARGRFSTGPNCSSSLAGQELVLDVLGELLELDVEILKE